jgi:hypothetical protein
MGEIPATCEETHVGTPPPCDVIADRSAEHGVAGLEGIEDRALGDGAGNVEDDFAFQLRQRPQVHREDHAYHGSVWASTESTAGRSRTMGVQLSPESAEA